MRLLAEHTDLRPSCPCFGSVTFLHFRSPNPAAMASLSGRGSTLYHLDDLPFSVPAMPASYGAFREKARGGARRPVPGSTLSAGPPALGCLVLCAMWFGCPQSASVNSSVFLCLLSFGQVTPCAVREAVRKPSERRGLPAGSPDPGEIPTLAELGIQDLPEGGAGSSPAGGLCGAGALVGGETEALRRLKAFISEGGQQAGCGQCAGGEKGKGAGAGAGAKAAGPCGANFSCKVSPWLALGCLSPRRMYWELKAASEKAGGVVAKAPAAPAAAVAPTASTRSGGGVATAGSLQWCGTGRRLCLPALCAAGWLPPLQLKRDLISVVS